MLCDSIAGIGYMGASDVNGTIDTMLCQLEGDGCMSTMLSSTTSEDGLL